MPNLKKNEPNWVQNYILYKTDAKNALHEKKANFDYTCIYKYIESQVFSLPEFFPPIIFDT